MRFRFIVAASVLVFLAPGCARPLAMPTNAARYGVSLSPESFDGPAFQRFLDLSTSAGGILSWAGNAEDFLKPNNAGHVTVVLAHERGLRPLIVTGATEKQLDDAAMRARLLAAIETFAKEEQPEYVGVGNEVNFHFRTAVERKTSAAFFADAVTQIKRVSPTTKVFPIFQYEWLRGFHGGLFGGKNDPNVAEWDIFDDYSQADLIAFTTYPGLIYPNPEDIPIDYYSVLRDHTSSTVAFTEIGWPRGTAAKGWESSPEEQARFIHRLPELMMIAKPAFVIWPFLFDQKANAFSETLGLLPDGQAEAPGWTAWRELVK